MQLVVVTGLSGAGRSTALRVLEDLGFYCVDNLPPQLVPEVLALTQAGGDWKRVGFGIDVRGGQFLEGAAEVLDTLEKRGIDVQVVFLEASEASLVRRFSESRRPHLLAPDGDVQAAIRSEQQRLATLRARATHIIDTTDLNVHQLRKRMVELASSGPDKARMVTRLVSFGFKYGLPYDADIVFDVRYLPNPHFVPELQPKTGLDSDVSHYVIDTEAGQELLDDLGGLLTKLLPRYAAEGKAYLTVAIGCTGGRHRSVAIVEELGKRFADQHVAVAHRDADRRTV